MKIFYSSYLPQNKDIANNFADEIIPGILRNYIKDYGRFVCHFEDDTPQSASATQTTLSELRSADAFICEASLPNTALGFQLAYANLHFIPTLYLYTDASTQKPSPLITNNPSRKVWIKKYSEDTIDHELNKFIKMVERQMETARTSFMSTREIDDYISETSDRSGIPKGEVIRQALSEAASRENGTSV